MIKEAETELRQGHEESDSLRGLRALCGKTAINGKYQTAEHTEDAETRRNTSRD
jgi:hypothetical protein